jgi:hypothetical protein
VEAVTESSVDHYIIVKVSDIPAAERPVPSRSNLGRVSGALRDFTEEYPDIPLSFVPFNAERSRSVFGTPSQWTLVRDLFEFEMAAAKRVSRPRRQRAPKQQALIERSRYRGRAIRAAFVVLGYFEKYGEDVIEGILVREERRLAKAAEKGESQA